MKAPTFNPSIGGFLPLDLSPARGPGVWSVWGKDAPHVACYHNARSGLYHLLNQRAQRLWVPSYICSDVIAAATKARVTISYYPVGANLAPNLEFLDENIRPGDYAMVVCYFGRPLDQGVYDLVARHPDVVWIEDRAQALWIADTRVLNYTLYSPRKVIGVPDGGIVISHADAIPPSLPQEMHTSFTFMVPSLWRAEDPEGLHAAECYQLYKTKEAEQRPGDLPMSRLTQARLMTIDLQPLINARQRNYQHLETSLGAYAFYSQSCSKLNYAPFGFPIRLKSLDPVLSGLHRAKIFAARYWANLPSSPKDCPHAHKVSQQLLMLPCDHRYTQADMEYIIEVAQTLISQYNYD